MLQTITPDVDTGVIAATKIYANDVSNAADAAAALTFAQATDAGVFQTTNPGTAESANLITGATDGFAYTSSSTMLGTPTASAGDSYTNTIAIGSSVRMYYRAIFANMTATIGKVFNSSGTAVGTLLKTSLVAEGDHWYIDIAFAAQSQLVMNIKTAEKTTAKLFLTHYVAPTKIPIFVPKSVLMQPIVVPPNLVTSVNNFYYANGAANLAATSAPTVPNPYNSVAPFAVTLGADYTMQGVGSVTAGLGTIVKFVRADNTLRTERLAAGDLIVVGAGYKFTVPAGYSDVVSIVVNIASADAATVVIQQNSIPIDPAGYNVIKPQWLPAAVPNTSDTKAIAMYDRGYVDKPMAAITSAYGILAIGQSNMAGRIAYTELPSWFTALGNQIPGVNYSYNAEDVTAINTAFTTYAVAPSAQWAFDLYLYKLLLDYWRTKTSNPAYPIYAIKHAVGATSISVNVTAPGAGFWTPRFDQIPTTKGALLKGMEFRYRQIKAGGSGAAFDIRCVIKHQGETDATDASNYYQNAKEEMSYVRAVLKSPYIPYLFMGINSSSTQYSAIVEAAKQQLASELANVFYVPSLNGTTYLNTDVLHMNSLGAQPMANAVFAIIKDYIPNITLMGDKP